MSSAGRVALVGLLVLGLLIGLFLIVGGVTIGWVLIPHASIEEIKQTTVLEPDNDLYKDWSNTSLPVAIKLYFFNYTNPDAIMKGQKFKIKECGPYVYKEKREKVEMRESPDGSMIAYREKITYTFDPDASNGEESDRINTPNTPFIALAHKAFIQDIPFAATSIELLAKDADDPQQIIKENVTIKSIVFKGWKLPSLFELVDEQKLPVNMQGLRFGYLRNMNATPGNEYVIRTGRKGASDHLGEIVSFKGMKELNWWSTQGLPPDSTHHFCNKINGTDGFIFPPLLTESKRVQVFSGCRSVSFVFDSVVLVRNIPGFRFKPTDSYLGDPAMHKDEACFCQVQSDKVARYCTAGFMRMWPCTQDSPLVTSKPHFLHGADDLFKPIIMSPPDEAKHGMHMIFEPNSGTPLAIHQRAQVNIEVQPFDEYAIFDDLDFSNYTDRQSVILPIFWADEGYDIDEAKRDEIYEKIVRPMKILQGVRLGSVIFGVILTFFCAIFIGRSIRKVEL